MTEPPKKAKSKRQAESPSDKPPAAYFLSLDVERVLCFKDKQVLDLSDGNGNPAQWTVILGNNGVGKTTLLRCLAGMEVVHLPEYEDALPLLFRISSSKYLRNWNDLETLFLSGARCSASFLSGIKLTEINEDSTLFPRGEAPKVYCSIDIGVSISKSDCWKSIENLQCYGYGAIRKPGKISLTDSFNSENSASLFLDDCELINAEEWLLQTDYSIKTASGQTYNRLKQQFDQMTDALKRILPDVEDIQIAPADEERSRPTTEFLTPYGWVQLSSLGLGYRTMIAWMVDLAARLFQRYPDSPDPLAEPAIVLVDEIDLHLHPKWQRTIMSFLTERFPNTQFIVTAHSPLVVQAAKNANIVLLRREGDRVVIDNNPEIVDNWRVDQVLTSVFELPTARPADVEPLLIRRQELLSQAHLSESDEAELRELEAGIGTLPTGESLEDIKAMDIIRRAAKLLENS